MAVSTTMRLVTGGFQEAVGLREQVEGRIIIKPSQLGTLASYAGTLLHEVAHAVSATPDLSPGFEEALTTELGLVAAHGVGAQ